MSTEEPPMTATEVCRCCGTLLEVHSKDGALDAKSGRLIGVVVRYRCSGCQRGGSIIYQDGRAAERMGPAVRAGYRIQTDERREPTPSIDHQRVAADGGTPADD